MGKDEVREALRELLTEERLLLSDSGRLMKCLAARVNPRYMSDLKALQVALRDARAGEILLAADGGGIEARHTAKARIRELLLMANMQERRADFVVNALAFALGWEEAGLSFGDVRRSTPLAVEAYGKLLLKGKTLSLAEELESLADCGEYVRRRRSLGAKPLYMPLNVVIMGTSEEARLRGAHALADKARQEGLLAEGTFYDGDELPMEGVFYIRAGRFKERLAELPAFLDGFHGMAILAGSRQEVGYSLSVCEALRFLFVHRVSLGE